MEDGYVLVIGSSGIDVKGRPVQEINWGTPNLGRVRRSVGGVARNIAENLARLEVPTVLLTAVGKDPAGKRVIRACERVGMDCNYVRYIPGCPTGTYMALLKPDGQLHAAISDFEVISYIDSDYILEHEYLIEDAEMVVLDATLSPDTLDTIFDVADRCDVRVAADPTTPFLAGRLCPHIGQLFLLVPNANEVTPLCGIDAPLDNHDLAYQAVRDLVAKGAEIAVVTLGEDGLVYADGNGGGHLRAIHTKVVDSTGAGDAFCAAAIFGILNEVPVDEAMRLGITAASLTLESRHTVLPHLSQELLYDKLMA